MKCGFKAAIFDMDGTLLASMRYWRFTALEYLLAHDLPVDGDLLLRMPVTSARKIIPEALARRGIHIEIPEFLPELQHYMDLHYQSVIHPKPGAQEFVRRLGESGITMAVATAAPREVACRALARHGMLEPFAFVTDITEVGRDKRDPDFYRIVAARMGAKTEECVMFEDALYAVQGAKDAGMTVCAIADDAAGAQKGEIMRLADVYVTEYESLLNGSGGFLPRRA